MTNHLGSYNDYNISSYLLKHNTYKYSNFYPQNEKKFFLNDFMHYENHHGSGVTMGLNGIDINTEYRTNFHGFRTQELKSVDVVFSGDSFTYGVGLPENAIWASQISNAMGYDSLNLGCPGASVTGVVHNLMHYFKVYGNPKNLFCMFPDFSRMHLFLNSDILVSTNNLSQGGFTETQFAHLGNLDERPKYSKKPYNIEDVMNLEIPYYYSLKAIQSLEQYCEQANINFMWSVFHAPDHEAIRMLKDNEFGYYSNFVDTKQGNWIKHDISNDVYLGEDYNHNIPQEQQFCLCHEEYREIYESYFDLAGDVENGRQRAHHGVHRHMHVAEIFLDKLKS